MVCTTVYVYTFLLKFSVEALQRVHHGSWLSFGWATLMHRHSKTAWQYAACILFLLMVSFTPSWKCAAHLSSVHSRRVGWFSGESCSICVSLPYVLMYRCATMLKEMYWNVSHSVPMYFVSVCMCKCLSENGHSSSLQELGQIMRHNASLFPSFLCMFRYFCHFFISFTVVSKTCVQILTA